MNKTLIIISFIILIFLQNLLFATDNQKHTHVSIQLQWKHQFQFAGYYMAKEKGFYSNSGLDVTIKELSWGENPLDNVLKKEVNFAVGRSSLIINKSNGAKIVLLASIFQSSPHILMSLQRNDIIDITDFKDKRIMITGDAETDLVILSMLFSKNIRLDDMQVLKHSFKLEDLVYDNTDLIASYLSNEPYILKEKYGLESNIFDPKDYGFDFYSDILFTHEDEVKMHPIRVKKFKKASIKGWEYAFNNIEETVDLILEKYNTQNKTKEALLYEAKELKKLAYYNTNQLGEIQKNKIEKTFDYYNIMGEVKNKINFDNFIFDEINNKLTLTKKEKLYLDKKKEIKMCIDPDWMPFEKFDKNGVHVGLTSDYFKYFERQLKTKITPIKTSTWSESLQFIKEKKCDILSAAMQTRERVKYLNFTHSYLDTPLGLSTKVNVPFINNLKKLRNKKIAIVKNYAFINILKIKYPNISFIEVKNVKEGLQKVRDEELFGFISSIADISYHTQRYFTGQLKITGKLTDVLELAIAIRKDQAILVPIFDKAILTIDEQFKHEMQNKYFAVKYEKETDYSLFWKSTFFFLSVIMMILYWSYRLKVEKQKNEIILHKLTLTKRQLKMKNKRLETLAATDKLTNLFNRVKLDDTLSKEILRVKRFQHNLGIIILDIDDFKVVNDTYGHIIGDKVLIQLSSILKYHTRNVDIVGRWGGEEFLIICPETSNEGLIKLAQALRKRIEEHDFPRIKKVTASFGLASFEDRDTIDSFINKADKALYYVKKHGKNDIKLYDEI